MRARKPTPSPHAKTGPDVPGEFGEHVLLTRIARGGMADVYLAERRLEYNQGNFVAVKMLLPKLAVRKKFIDMFRSEGRLGLMLKHRNIVRTLDLGAIDGRYYIVMDFIDGQDLGKAVRYFRSAKAPFPLNIALFVVREVLRGLSHAHNLTDEARKPLNLVNRDVSPANVMLSYSGTVRLIDFGIAQALLNYRSQIGSIKGKISYMSPEQVRGLALDARSDLFSLGTITYQLLTGREPFQAPSEFEQMERVREANPPSVSEVNPRIDHELSDIVSKCMSKDPALRFQTAGEMIDAIETYANKSNLSLDGEHLAEFMQTEFAHLRAELVGNIDGGREIYEAASGDFAAIFDDDTDPTDPIKKQAMVKRSGEVSTTNELKTENVLIRQRPANPKWLLPAFIALVVIAVLLTILAIVR